MPTLSVNGATLHYAEQGRGEPIVFAHGLLWSGALYQYQVAALRDRYRCVTFDFRGQGQSEVTDGGYDMETLTDDTVALIERLGLAPCHFVGLSMGGFVGMRIAARRRELLRSLVLLNTAADSEPRKNIPRYRAMGLVTRLFGIGVLARPVMKILFGRPFLDDPARGGLRAEMRRRLEAIDRKGALRALGGVIARAPVEDELGKIATPTLIIAGAEDRAILVERTRRAAVRIAGAKLVVLPRAGHTSAIEEPAAVNETIGRFLDELRR